MGVDASYIYGYMAKNDDVEWDIEYLKQKFNLEEKLTGYLSDYTYGDLVEWLENDEVDDWYDIAEIIGIRSDYAYDQEYLYFTHFEVLKKFNNHNTGQFDELVKEYAKECGVKNYEIFKWDEFGYFS